MTLLNRSTCRRLRKLRQLPSVWEGDRYSLQDQPSRDLDGVSEPKSANGDCILWVDGAVGSVRSMEMVPADVGQEAVVRGLLRAIEHPSGQAQPARPKKIVVRNRELQFFLRGVLQDLDIEVSYSETLPLIDEIFRELQSFISGNQPRLPEKYAQSLEDAAIAIWHDAPWQKLDEEKIIEVCLNGQDVEPLYLSFLGMLGVEYGVLMYRSKESLKAFRQTILELDESSQELIEEAFLQQDCFFLTFESTPNMTDFLPTSKRSQETRQLMALNSDPLIKPEFGNLHPLEGMRPNLYEEEALIVLAALRALHLFLKEYAQSIYAGAFPSLSAEYPVEALAASNSSENDRIEDDSIVHAMTVTLSTLPEFAQELASMVDESLDGIDGGDFPSFTMPMINLETVPPGTMSQVGRIPWDVLAALRQSTKCYQPANIDFPMNADGFPIVLLQTSRPKAMKLIEVIQSAGGLQSLGFMPGEDQWGAPSYDLGVLQTDDNTFHIFTEYENSDAIHQRAKKKWNERCQQTNGYCGLIIAKGITGAAKGNPALKDMVALFEVPSLTPEGFGLGLLRLVPNLEQNFRLD
ncbi:MAG: hypothetical protein AAGD25_13360 [Cyanobacteria bacterium P01_F01_bin.150]